MSGFEGSHIRTKDLVPKFIFKTHQLKSKINSLKRVGEQNCRFRIELKQFEERDKKNQRIV